MTDSDNTPLTAPNPLLDVTDEEWKAAQAFFLNPKNKDEVKFRRKDNEGQLRSFIKVGNEVFVMASKLAVGPERDNYSELGKGGFGKVKVVQNRVGENFAVKVEKRTKNEHENLTERDAQEMAPSPVRSRAGASSAARFSALRYTGRVPNTRPLPAHFLNVFGDLVDRRVKRSQRYPMLMLLFFALCATLSGAGDGWDAMAAFTKRKKGWFERFLEFPKRTPCSRHVSTCVREAGAEGAGGAISAVVGGVEGGVGGAGGERGWQVGQRDV